MDAPECKIESYSYLSAAQPCCFTCYVFTLNNFRKLRRRTMLLMRILHLWFSNIPGTQLSFVQTKCCPNFLQDVHKTMEPAQRLPQNCCYFASASVWQKAINILHTLCKLTTTRQQRPTVHRSDKSTYRETKQSQYRVLLKQKLLN